MAFPRYPRGTEHEYRQATAYQAGRKLGLQDRRAGRREKHFDEIYTAVPKRFTSQSDIRKFQQGYSFEFHKYEGYYDKIDHKRKNPRTKLRGRAKSIRLRNFTGTVRQNPDKTITVKGLNHKAAKKRVPARKRTTKRKR